MIRSLRKVTRVACLVIPLVVLAPRVGGADAPVSADKPMKNVDVARFEELRAQKGNVVLDVRTKKEFEDGHMPGAVNIDVLAPDFEEKVSKLAKDKVYLVHCASGRRSVQACEKLDKLQFRRLYHLEGGYKLWVKAGHKPQK